MPRDPSKNAYAGSSGTGGGSIAISDVTGLQTALDSKADQNVFIQTSTPSGPSKYLWIDTTGGNLQFKVETGA